VSNGNRISIIGDCLINGMIFRPFRDRDQKNIRIDDRKQGLGFFVQPFIHVLICKTLGIPNFIGLFDNLIAIKFGDYLFQFD
jgi:hypothetical protein